MKKSLTIATILSLLLLGACASQTAKPVQPAEPAEAPAPAVQEAPANNGLPVLR